MTFEGPARLLRVLENSYSARGGSGAGDGPIAETRGGSGAGDGPIAETRGGSGAGDGPIAEARGGSGAGDGPIANKVPVALISTLPGAIALRRDTLASTTSTANTKVRV